MGKLDGRVAVITGGGRGIGRAIACRYADEGATVVVSSRTRGDLDEVVGYAESAGATGRAVVADAMDRSDARRPVREAIDWFGRVDILVNNVGGTVGRGHDPFSGDDESFESTIVLCLTSAWWTTSEALPLMREQRWGRIVNIGSGASKSSGGSLAYTTAKHGLVGFTRQLAAATGELGITVNCLCPGWTNTSLVDWDRIARAKGVTADVARAQAEGESAQKRILEPDELAGMAALLASDEGRGITGQVLSVDGGYKI
jgi:NAD(P)-dependent dehydrogenase (short-subunit alcohol dehydrogenase family)